MKTRIYLLSLITLLCVSCHNKAETKGEQTEQGADSIRLFNDSLGSTIDSAKSVPPDWLSDLLGVFTSTIDSTKNKSLNEIRFENWTDEDWYDNDYYRFLRTCFDECAKGEINENTPVLQEYKSVLHNQFFIYHVEEYFLGGLYITLGFLNEPKVLYQTVVYSAIDEETDTIMYYELRQFSKSEDTSSFTKKQVINIIKEHPGNKLW